MTRLFSTLLALSVLPTLASSVDAEDPPPKFAVADYVAGLTALADRYAVCSGEGVHTSMDVVKGGGTKTSRVRKSFAFTRDRGRTIETHSAPIEGGPRLEAKGKAKTSPKRRVYVYSPRYSFFLSSPSEDGGFVIDELEDGPELGKRAFWTAMRNPARFATYGYGMSFAWLVALPTFHVEAVREVEPALGSRRIRVDFTNPRAQPAELSKKSVIHSEAGWLVLSPELGWLPHEYGLVKSPNARPSALSTTVGYVEYALDPGGPIRATRYGSRDYKGRHESDPAGSGLAPTSTEEFEFTSFRLGDTPEREFTLAAFGLPEFAEPAAQLPERRFPWWIVAASAGPAGLAVVLWWVAKRPRIAKQPAA